MKKVNYNGTIITLTDNIEKAMNSMENSNYYDALYYLRNESSNIIVENIRKAASTKLYNVIIEETNSKNFDSALSKLNQLRNQSGVPYDISRKFNELENQINEAYHSYLLENVIELNNKKIYEKALTEIKKLENMNNLSYNIKNRINENKNIIVKNIAFSKINEAFKLIENKQFNDCYLKIEEIKNIENFPNELRGEIKNLEGCFNSA